MGFLSVALVVALGALGLLFYEQSQLQGARTRMIAEQLQPIAALLKEDQAILKELQAEPFTEKDAGTKTAAFAAEGDRFRNYASAWRDRWNSVMELFMAGGNYAAAGTPFPNGFPEAVQAEITAAK